MRARDRAARPTHPSSRAAEETAESAAIGLQWPHGVQNSSHGVRASTGAPGASVTLSPPDQAGSRSVLGQAHPHRPERNEQVTEAGPTDHANQRQRAQRLFQYNAGARFPSASSTRRSTRWAMGVSVACSRRSRCSAETKQRGWLDPLGYMTGRLPSSPERGTSRRWPVRNSSPRKCRA